MAPFLAELLNDSYAVVRFIGYHALKDIPEFSEFDYDFVGPELDRQSGQLSALRHWESLTTKPSPAKALLVDEQNELNKEEFRALRDQREDPPMILVE